MCYRLRSSPKEVSIVKELRINEWIRAKEVLLIGENGERVGVVPVRQAIQMARERSLDLVEVAPTAVPPVCRILDYGRYKFEQAKKEREARKTRKASLSPINVLRKGGCQSRLRVKSSRSYCGRKP